MANAWNGLLSNVAHDLPVDAFKQSADNVTLAGVQSWECGYMIQ